MINLPSRLIAKSFQKMNNANCYFLAKEQMSNDKKWPNKLPYSKKVNLKNKNLNIFWRRKWVECEREMSSLATVRGTWASSSPIFRFEPQTLLLNLHVLWMLKIVQLIVTYLQVRTSNFITKLARFVNA